MSKRCVAAASRWRMHVSIQLFFCVSLAFTACAAAPGEGADAPPVAKPGTAPADDSQPLFAVDESLWTVFYDLPSRRFRAVKDAYVRGAFDLMERDLSVSASYLRIEAERSRIPGALNGSAERLEQLGGAFSAGARPSVDLDALFADVHWTLAQHFVALALQARDQARHRDAGRYLTAIAHHLERTALWSQAVVDQELVEAVDGLRRQAVKLERAPAGLSSREAYRDRPVHNAMRLVARFADAFERKPLIRLESSR